MAVYTKLTTEHKESIKKLYNLDKNTDFVEISEGILNTNYLVKEKNKKHVFRILEGDRDIHEELKELELLSFLNENDISCPQATVNNLGKNHMFVQEKMGCLFNFIPGEKVINIDCDVLKKIGSTLGRLHNLSKERTIKRTRKIDLDFFHEKLLKVDLKDILKEDHDLIMERYKEVKKVDFSDLPRGIVHNDIFPDNVFMGDKLSLIDFNDCVKGPLVIDLAIVINFWIKIKEFSRDKEDRLIKTFLDSYEKERKLLPEEKKMLKKMVLKMALTFIFLRINKFYIEDNRGTNMEIKSYKDLMVLLKEETNEIY